MLSEILNRCRDVRPMVHCIANMVTANDCANLVLACGASPIMGSDPEEVAEITAECDGLVLNLGTPSARKIEALIRAGRSANGKGIPVVFDPVGVGASRLRMEAGRKILEGVRLSVIRGNASEIGTLISGSAAHRGVDVDEAMASDPAELARELSCRTGAVVVLSGTMDIVTDGFTTYRVKNGHAMMRNVTGSGCQLSCLIGAYAASNPTELMKASLAAVCGIGLCGELAHSRLGDLDGNASYRNYMIDALFHLKGPELDKGANYEIL